MSADETSTWTEVTVDVPSGLTQTVQSTLFELGANGTEETYRPGEAPPPRQPWDTGPAAPKPRRRLIRGWFENVEPAYIESELDAKLRLQSSTYSIHVAPLQPIDWEENFRKQHPPIRISEQLVIAPPWCEIKGALTIEPGIGFGTGSHTTTRQVLQALEQRASEFKTVLDVGCGSGILALAAAHLGLKASGFDVQASAVERAKVHASLNNLDVYFGVDPIGEWTSPFDMVLANLHADLLVELSAHLIRLTDKVLITAGILQTKQDAVKRVFGPSFEHLEVNQDGEWVSMVFSHPKKSTL